MNLIKTVRVKEINDERQSRHTHPQHDGETLEHRHQVHHHTGRPADPGQSEARRSLDQLHVLLHLHRLPPPVQARRHRRHPGRRRLRVRHQPNLRSHFAHARGDPDPHDPALHDTARPCEPHAQPRRGIALHPRRGVQRGRRVLDILLRPRRRARSDPPRLHPPLRLDLAPHRTVEVIVLALILRYAWTWPRTAPSATMATKTTTTTSIS